jgi:hypothetical protein
LEWLRTKPPKQKGKMNNKKTRNIPTDSKLREFAERHLSYEVDMLIYSANELANQKHSQGFINAFLESFTIHVRALIDFIWEPQNQYDDDAYAVDYFTSPEEWERVKPDFPSILQPARRRTGKEVAHLSYARLKVTKKEKQWDVTAMAKAVLSAVHVFANNADPVKLGDFLLKFKQTE